MMCCMLCCSISLNRQDFSNLPAFEKNFYHEHPAVAARTADQVAYYRHAREIHVDGHDVPRPVTTFEEASFPGMQVSSKDVIEKSACCCGMSIAPHFVPGAPFLRCLLGRSSFGGFKV
jgi:hypothetical protein